MMYFPCITINLPYETNENSINLHYQRLFSPEIKVNSTQFGNGVVLYLLDFSFNVLKGLLHGLIQTRSDKK